MKILLIGSFIFKKTLQKLEYHLPEHGHKTVSSFYLDAIAETDPELFNKELAEVEAGVIVTNETGYLDDDCYKYAVDMLNEDKPVVTLNAISKEEYSKLHDLPVETLAGLIANEVSFAKPPSKSKPNKKKLTQKDSVTGAKAEKFFIDAGVEDNPEEGIEEFLIETGGRDPKD